MLYDRWRDIVDQQRNETALVDEASGRRWTFKELAAEAECGLPERTPAVFPSGISGEFIVAVLRAWRSRVMVCPLEQGQTPAAFASLPAGCAHLKSTSASTGLPRLIAFTEAQLAADVDQIVATMGLRREWPNLGVISLAHSYGFSNLVLPLLLHGIPLIVVQAPLPEPLRRAASLISEVTLPAVPALWRAWLDGGMIPPNVRLAISAGAPLPLALETETFARCGLKIHNFYGASECGGIAFDSSSAPREDPTCVGAPMRGVHLSLGADECLCVDSPAAGLCYWPEPDARLGGGRFLTGDLAELKGGQVWLRGRQGDLINVAGRKVSPESIERALASHPGVKQCIVFGASNADVERGEWIVACLATHRETTIEALKQHLLQQLPAWQMPRDWWIVPELPANQRGKLARSHWRDEYLRTRCQKGQRLGHERLSGS